MTSILIGLLAVVLVVFGVRASVSSQLPSETTQGPVATTTEEAYVSDTTTVPNPESTRQTVLTPSELEALKKQTVIITSDMYEAAKQSARDAVIAAFKDPAVQASLQQAQQQTFGQATQFLQDTIIKAQTPVNTEPSLSPEQQAQIQAALDAASKAASEQIKAAGY